MRNAYQENKRQYIQCRLEDLSQLPRISMIIGSHTFSVVSISIGQLLML